MSLESWKEAYVQCVEYMRILYHRCKLVHADLSEYNLLLVIFSLIVFIIDSILKYRVWGEIIDTKKNEEELLLALKTLFEWFTTSNGS